MSTKTSKDQIALVAYDPNWPAQFVAEERLLREALDPALLLDIQHFGSTAIPGLAAKPIIDILIAVPLLSAARSSFVAPLDALGYAFWADNPKTDRLFFVKGMPPYGERRTHHIHVAEPGAEPWQRLPFRDYLRAHSEAAQRYEILKRDLAERYPNDREAYTAAKEDFVNDILARCE